MLLRRRTARLLAAAAGATLTLGLAVGFTGAGTADAFDAPDIRILDAAAIGIDPKTVGMKASPTRILDVYSPVAEKQNIVMKGPVKKMIARLLAEHGDRISGAIEKDLKTHDHDPEEKACLT